MRGAWTHQLIDEQKAKKAKDAEDESDAKRSLLQSPSGELVRRHFRGLQVSMRGGCQWDGVHSRRATRKTKDENRFARNRPRNPVSLTSTMVPARPQPQAVALLRVFPCDLTIAFARRTSGSQASMQHVR